MPRSSCRFAFLIALACGSTPAFAEQQAGAGGRASAPNAAVVLPTFRDFALARPADENGSVRGCTDLSALQGRTLYALCFYGDSTGNQNALHVSAEIPATGATADYQKNAVYGRVRTSDPSGSVLKDAVAVEGQAFIAAGNRSGRAWGLHGFCTVDAGADGYCLHEVEIINGAAAYQPAIGTGTSKVGLHVVARGTQDSTAGIVIGSTDGRRFGTGFVVPSATVVDNAYAVRDATGADLAYLGRNGDIGGRAATFTSATVDDALRVGTGGGVFYGPLRIAPRTVSALPACNPAAEGTVLMVTDAAAPAWNAPLVGGGSARVLALCTGMAWTAH